MVVACAGCLVWGALAVVKGPDGVSAVANGGEGLRALLECVCALTALLAGLRTNA